MNDGDNVDDIVGRLVSCQLCSGRGFIRPFSSTTRMLCPTCDGSGCYLVDSVVQRAFMRCSFRLSPELEGVMLVMNPYEVEF